MKKSLTFLLLGLLSFSTTATAQEESKDEYISGSVMTQKPVVCVDAAKVISSLSEQYEEKPILMGQEPFVFPDGSVVHLRIMLWINAKKGTFTVIQIPPPSSEEFAGKICILSSGSIENINEKAIRTMLGDQFI